MDEPKPCAEDRAVGSNQVLGNFLWSRLDVLCDPARHKSDGGLVKMSLKGTDHPVDKGFDQLRLDARN